MISKKKILVVDDDPVFRLMLETFLKSLGFNVTSAGNGHETRRILKNTLFDLILIDLRLPDIDGLELLKEIKKDYPQIPLILMTSFVNIRTAVNAIKEGAYEYITKPVNTDELSNAVQMALKNHEKRSNAFQKKSFDYLGGASKSSLEIIDSIKVVAPTNLSVLITGESGTGKEYVARMIHSESKRSQKPFVAIDCGVLSSDLAASELFGHLKGAFTGAANDKAGYFETAQDGTVFLDEIGNLSMDVQVMLLRALQEKQVRRIGSNKTLDIDVRIIAATNEDLKLAIAKGSFREDLYHRLNEFSIHILSLRDRKEDIKEFSFYFLDKANTDLQKSIKGIDPETLEAMLSYNWPGNLRELNNIIKRGVLLTPDKQNISRNYVPNEIFNLSSNQNKYTNTNNDFNLKEANSKQERDYIITVLEKVKYNKSSAARILNIDRKTLYNKLKQYGIDL